MLILALPIDAWGILGLWASFSLVSIPKAISTSVPFLKNLLLG